MAVRSSTDSILLVACRSSARRASSRLIPTPSSLTRISVLPASLTRTEIVAAPASIEFSTSSRTTAAGRSTTSPAAIWLATAGGSRRILPTGEPQDAADSIWLKSPTWLKSASSRASSAKRFARTAGSSAMTSTSSKKVAMAGESVANA